MSAALQLPYVCGEGVRQAVVQRAPRCRAPTVIGAGGSVNFPVTPVPAQAAAFLTASGLVKTADSPYYHSAFGVPFTLHMMVDETDPWAASAAPTIRADLQAAGINTDIETATSATAAGEALAGGYADMALLPVTFSPYLAQTLAWYTTLLGAPGKNGSEDWTAYDNTPFEQLVSTASQAQRGHRGGIYQQADMQLWDQMVSLPLYAEPAALAWSRSVGGVLQDPGARACCGSRGIGRQEGGVDQDATPTLPGQ